MSERIVNDPSQHGWVEDNGKWVWGASGGTGAGMVISESEPADKVEGMQWLNPTTGLVLFWDDEKWLQMPGGKDGAPGADGNIQDATEDGVIATWDDTNKQWTPESALTIDATGNVGIGGTPVSSSRRLMIKDVNDVRVDLRSGTDNDLGAIDFSDTSNNARGQIVYDHATDGMTFKTLSADRLTIDADGRVDIKGVLQLGDTNGTENAHLSMAGPANSTAVIKAGRKSMGFEFANPDGTLMSISSSGRVDITGSLYVNGTPKIGTVDLIKAFSKLRDAVKDEETVESLKESITNWIGGMIEEWESMQSEANDE